MQGETAGDRVTRFDVAEHITLAADSYGPETGAPVLMFHGGGQTRWSWGATAAALGAAGLLTHSLDLRGHGQSSWCPAGQYGLDRFAEDARMVARQMNTPPVIVGASLGGISSLLACGEAPGAPCAGLVLVDIAPQMNRAGTNRVGDFMRSTSGGFDDLDEAARTIAAYTGREHKPARRQGLTKNLRQADDGRWYWHWDPAFLTGDPTWDPASMESRMMAAARAIQAPVLIVRGSESDVLTRATMEHLREVLPHVEQAEIAGTGHMIAGDDNAAFNSAIMPFITRHAGSSAPDHG